ncbi:hypothetical protein SSS_03331 [Sarcoptes scabiei]|uniref:Uncharacterized protein n=1 Tax=Sarcoptes scabiei TaxID=52283 RepID=A0A834RC28_SARSC|nr:hypothetical protein SSS_03331 [Sarcoptes scabiei]
MNYLKKKINKVVHGNQKRANNDDDDFDDYVPEVPPHPSDSLNNQSNNFAKFDSTATAAHIGSILKSKEEEKSEPLSLEELKQREEEHRKIEKEKLRQQEEGKKDREDWQFFLSLTAKVDAVTSKTQSVLDKLKTESAVEEISKVEDPSYSDQFDILAPKTSGGWTAFEESEQYNPSDPIFTQQQQQQQEEEEKRENSTQRSDPKQLEPIVDENTLRISRELIDDFGFTNPAPLISIGDSKNSANILTFEESNASNSIDPFDTSFVDVDAIRSGSTIAIKPTLIKDIDVDEIDPFDTSHIESTIGKDLIS